MKKVTCYEIFKKEFCALFAIPVWGGFLLVSTEIGRDAVMFVPKDAIKNLVVEEAEWSNS